MSSREAVINLKSYHMFDYFHSLKAIKTNWKCCIKRNLSTMALIVDLSNYFKIYIMIHKTVMCNLEMKEINSSAEYFQ